MSRVKRSLKRHEFYRSYTQRMRKLKKTPKSRLQYFQILEAMGESMADILLERGVISFPFYIGEAVILRSISKRIKYDIDLSLKLKRKVPMFNSHTDGAVYRLSWMTREKRLKKSRVWSLKFHTSIKTRLSSILINKEVVYPDYRSMLNTK